LGFNFTKKIYDRARNKFKSLIGALGSCEVRSPDKILLTLECNFSIAKNHWSLEHLKLIYLFMYGLLLAPLLLYNSNTTSMLLIKGEYSCYT
jgi:hypothetical protein